MAKLSAAQRRAVPPSQRGVPSKGGKSGAFPIPDKAHARAALRLIGHAPASAKPRIRRLAAKFGVGTKKTS